jgi:hypothetical protein
MCENKLCSIKKIEECKRLDVCRACPTNVAGECKGCMHQTATALAPVNIIPGRVAETPEHRGEL